MIALLVILGVLLIGTWLYTMYLAWRIDEGTQLPLAERTPIVATWNQSARLTRRGWYSLQLHIKRALAWIGTQAQKALIKFFPKSATMFEERDKLIGLTHGPSSYYLKSITPPKGIVRKRLPRTKKQSIVAAPIDQVTDQTPE